MKKIKKQNNGRNAKLIRRKKILIATDSTLPRIDGVSIFLMNVAPRLAEEFDVTIFGPKYDSKVKIDLVSKYFSKINNVYANLSPFKAGDYRIPYPSRKKLIDEIKKCDCVFVQSIGPIGFFAIRYAKKYKKKIIAYTHSIEFDLWEKSVSVPLFFKKFVRTSARKMMMSAYKNCDYLIAPSEEIADLLEGEKIHTNIALAQVGVDEKFKPRKDKSAAKKRIGINEKKLVIGYVGRIGREKDLETLVLAFQELENARKDIVLLVVGDGLISEIKKSVKSENVIFAGMQENVVPYFQAMDIFVLPSLTETSSLATLEAMSCAIPVVVTPVGMLKNLIVRGKSGFLFPKGSVDALKQILEKLIKKKALREKVGLAGRKIILGSFSWDKTAEKIIYVINKL